MIGVSGLIGMSPNPYDEESDLFVANMKQWGVIDHAIFSLAVGMRGQ